MSHEPAFICGRRPAALASTTGALIALVAMAALISAPVAGGLASAEYRAGARQEAPSVRAVAEAVAAVARELAGTDHGDIDAVAAHCPMDSGLRVAPSVLVAQSDDQPSALKRTLGERVLDLPPPAC